LAAATTKRAAKGRLVHAYNAPRSLHAQHSLSLHLKSGVKPVPEQPNLPKPYPQPKRTDIADRSCGGNCGCRASSVLFGPLATNAGNEGPVLLGGRPRLHGPLIGSITSAPAIECTSSPMACELPRLLQSAPAKRLRKHASREHAQSHALVY